MTAEEKGEVTKARVVLDLRGEVCPWPAMYAGARLKRMAPGDVLEVVADGTSAVNVVPVVLEANPRPAGLSHSSEIVGISHKDPQQRISTEIFRFANLCI